MVRFFLFALAARGLPLLPRPVLSLLGVLAGALAYVGARSAREAVHRNLAVVMPELGAQARRRLAVQVFVHGAWSYLELFCLSAVTRETLMRSFRLVGWEHLEAALASGRGVIMVTAHLGAPSLAGQLIVLSGVPTMLTVEQLHPPALHNLVTRMRAVFGLRVVPVGPRTARAIVAALRRNEIVGIACDRDITGSGEQLDFFGKPTGITTAPATLALRTGATVVPAVGFRDRFLAGCARIEEPIEMPRTGDSTADVLEGTRRIVARIEHWVREHPEQWAVFTDIWPEHASPIG